MRRKPKPILSGFAKLGKNWRVTGLELDPKPNTLEVYPDEYPSVPTRATKENHARRTLDKRKR